MHIGETLGGAANEM